MTIAQMKERKTELGLTNQAIAERTGLPLSTVQKIFSGATSAPREATISALEKLLMPTASYGSKPAEPLIIREEPTAYGSRMWMNPYDETGPYTMEDYIALPEDLRVELIDGYFYDMAAPHGLHQAVCGYLHARLLDHVTRNKGTCYPFISPFDVQLDCDDKTVVQPDVLVMCDRGKFQRGHLFGAPDLVIEVLSPSTKRKDMVLKLRKYQNAGVREYWMVDTQKRVIIQHDLENGLSPAIYGFDAEIPVLIWEGKCRINLKEMSESIAFLLEQED